MKNAAGHRVWIIGILFVYSVPPLSNHSTFSSQNICKMFILDILSTLD